MRRTFLASWDLWDISPWWRNCLIVAITGSLVSIFAGGGGSSSSSQSSGTGQQYSGSYSSPTPTTAQQLPAAATPSKPIKIAPSIATGTVTTAPTQKEDFAIVDDNLKPETKKPTIKPSFGL